MKRKIELTTYQLQVLYKMVRTHIEWETGGCFGDGSEITEKKEYATAKKILEIISKS